MHTPETDTVLIRRVLAAIGVRADRESFAAVVAIANRAIQLLESGPLSDRHVDELCTALRARSIGDMPVPVRRAARAVFAVVCAAVEAPDMVAQLEAA